MNPLVIEGALKTPSIRFSDDGKLEISGKSIPENSIEFYQPVFDWLDKYIQQAGNNTVIRIQLEYFNTSSSKCLLDVFRKLETLQKSGKTVTVQWMYEEEDEDMMEAGEDYQSIIGIPFQIEKIATG